MIEAVEGLRFIDTTLRGNTPFMTSVPGGLWHGAKTDLPDTGFPENVYCVYQHMTSVDDVGGFGQRIGTTGVFLVKVYGPGSNIDAIEAAANLMDGLLQQAQGTTTTGTIYYLLRQSTQILPQNVNGKLALSILSQYRSYVQKTGS